jgi:hypothetical protein
MIIVSRHLSEWVRRLTYCQQLIWRGGHLMWSHGVGVTWTGGHLMWSPYCTSLYCIVLHSQDHGTVWWSDIREGTYSLIHLFTWVGGNRTIWYPNGQSSHSWRNTQFTQKRHSENSHTVTQCPSVHTAASLKVTTGFPYKETKRLSPRSWTQRELNAKKFTLCKFFLGSFECNQLESSPHTACLSYCPWTGLMETR